MNKKDFKKGLSNFYKFQKDVGEVIGYGQIDCDISDAFINANWSLDKENLWIQEQDGDEYSFTVSSLGNKGHDLYMGKVKGLTLLMVFEENFDDTEIFILTNKLKETD